MSTDPIDEMMGAGSEPVGLEAAEDVDASDIARVLADPRVTDIIRRTINDQVQAALAAIVPASPAATASPDMSVLLEFSRTVTELVNQGVPHAEKKVPPEVMAKREAARIRMRTLIAERNDAIRANPHDNSQWPEYRVMDVTFIHESLLQPLLYDPVTKRMLPNEVMFDGVPNRALMPLNAHARAIHDAFLDWTGGNGVPGIPAVQEVAISPNGITFRGQMPKTLRQHLKGGEIHNTVFNEDPDVVAFRERTGSAGPIDPTASHVRVLGTLHQPAIQSASGETAQMRQMRLSVPGGNA